MLVDVDASRPARRAPKLRYEPRLQTAVAEGVAGGDLAGVEAAVEPLHPLGGPAVGEALGHDLAARLALERVVADGRRRPQPLLDVALVEAVLPRQALARPDPGVAVGLQLHAHRHPVGLHLRLLAAAGLHLIGDA